MTTKREALTDAKVRSLKPGPGKQQMISDATCPGLKIRVTSASATYLLWKRVPGTKSASPVARVIGEIGTLSLEQARTKARLWLGLIRSGRDPYVEEEKERQAEALKRAVTFEAVAEDFIREKLPSERNGRDVAREIRRDLIPVWKGRPISDIQRRDVVGLVRRKKLTAPVQAGNLLGLIKRMWRWIIAQEVYGVEASPCSEIKGRDIVGEKKIGSRILTDDEIFALWRAAARQPFPYRQIYHLLLLNGLRLNEVCDAPRPEFNFADRDWTIPKERMKGKNHKARPHLVPLTSATLEIFGTLPTLTDGPYLFSLNGGKSPVWLNQKVTDRFQADMIRILKALARKRGHDPAKVVMEHWTNHDLRRTMRTNLSRIRDRDGRKFPDEVKEAVIAHAKSGLRATYDKHEFADEKFECLEAWAARLNEIVNGSPRAKVIEISAERLKRAKAS